TYTAQVARLTRQGDEAQMVMVNGTTQRYNLATGELSVLDFERLVYDLGTIVRSTEDRRRAAGEFYFYELINPAETLRINNPRQYGAFIAEGHDQLSSPLYALALPLMALAGLLAGGFRRGGFAGRIGIVVAAAVLGRVAGVAVKAQVAADPTLWPSLYAVPGALILGSLALLILSGRARSPRRARVFAEGNPG
ncbi:MAG: LptF/LptG family permease, partial [Pseudomonadota bacterium]